MAEISLLLPTRGRKALVSRLLQSLSETTSNLSKIEIILYLDEDDTDSQSLSFEKDLQVKKIVGPRTTMGTYNTKCFENATGKIIILINDDIIVRTPRWDQILLDFDATHPDKIYLGWLNDLHDMYKQGKMGPFPILSRKTCELLSIPFPSSYQGEFIDCHIFDIFKRLGKKGINRTHYFKEIIFEHMHFSLGKASIDQTYLDRRKYEDDSVFVSLSALRKKAAERLIAFIQGTSIPDPVEYPPVLRTNSYPIYFKLLFRSLLLDWSLPVSWKSYLFLWLSWRHFAKQGQLIWIKRWVKKSAFIAKKIKDDID